MTRFGYFLAAEEHGPKELLHQARLAERAGFEGLWISDHFHPWLDEQGHSPFVWAVIGAIATHTSLPITTAVTCPLIRIHPVIVAQAAATCAVISDGRFRLGVGTGENLNEHILESRWPPAEVRLEMLEEAIILMKRLFTGQLVTHHGKHYNVDTARLYTHPQEAPPIYMSAFGEKAAVVAAQVADGFVSTAPNAELIEQFRKAGGRDKITQGGIKVCYGQDAAQARKTVHRLWPTQGIKGEASQILPLPRHFSQLAEMVTEESAVNGSPCGPDPEVHVAAIRDYVDAGYDEIYINQIGPDQEEFFTFYANEVLPRLR
ncbi:TIGR03557 family F420-dependent LLM class oxidoreductase [Sinosporangium siamense]|uniref:LLM class F420-dependent oxidoreductase n=1 Tax=Sinosporangium siamense TaxID=1367973 RepID=A0A919RMP9_9ACTN|nr:TIGR03557 family F420-dependent LLM class oxidoreductase [Sinosporangium siamense]GII96027.1 LLM class F420-dependent oxidoreductase [Sinosporangium siamense]